MRNILPQEVALSCFQVERITVGQFVVDCTTICMEANYGIILIVTDNRIPDILKTSCLVGRNVITEIAVELDYVNIRQLMMIEQLNCLQGKSALPFVEQLHEIGDLVTAIFQQTPRPETVGQVGGMSCGVPGITTGNICNRNPQIPDRIVSPAALILRDCPCIQILHKFQMQVTVKGNLCQCAPGFGSALTRLAGWCKGVSDVNRRPPVGTIIAG